MLFCIDSHSGKVYNLSIPWNCMILFYASHGPLHCNVRQLTDFSGAVIQWMILSANWKLMAEGEQLNMFSCGLNWNDAIAVTMNRTLWASIWTKIDDDSDDSQTQLSQLAYWAHCVKGRCGWSGSKMLVFLWRPTENQLLLILQLTQLNLSDAVYVKNLRWRLYHFVSHVLQLSTLLEPLQGWPSAVRAEGGQSLYGAPSQSEEKLCARKCQFSWFFFRDFLRDLLRRSWIWQRYWLGAAVAEAWELPVRSQRATLKVWIWKLGLDLEIVCRTICWQSGMLFWPENRETCPSLLGKTLAQGAPVPWQLWGQVLCGARHVRLLEILKRFCNFRRLPNDTHWLHFHPTRPSTCTGELKDLEQN